MKARRPAWNIMLENWSVLLNVMLIRQPSIWRECHLEIPCLLVVYVWCDVMVLLYCFLRYCSCRCVLILLVLLKCLNNSFIIKQRINQQYNVFSSWFSSLNSFYVLAVCAVSRSIELLTTSEAHFCDVEFVNYYSSFLWPLLESVARHFGLVSSLMRANVMYVICTRTVYRVVISHSYLRF